MQIRENKSFSTLRRESRGQPTSRMQIHKTKLDSGSICKKPINIKARNHSPKARKVLLLL